MRYFFDRPSFRDGSGFFDAFCPGVGENYFPWGGMILMFIGLAIVGLLIYLVVKGKNPVALVQGSGGSASVPKDTDYYVSILKEDYAKGKISNEEFQRKVQILRENE